MSAIYINKLKTKQKQANDFYFVIHQLKKISSCKVHSLIGPMVDASLVMTATKVGTAQGG